MQSSAGQWTVWWLALKICLHLVSPVLLFPQAPLLAVRQGQRQLRLAGVLSSLLDGQQAGSQTGGHVDKQAREGAGIHASKDWAVQSLLSDVADGLPLTACLLHCQRVRQAGAAERKGEEERAVQVRGRTRAHTHTHART